LQVREDDFELLCVDGTRRGVRFHGECHWGHVPGDALVTTSAKSVETRRSYQNFFNKLVDLFGLTGSVNASRTRCLSAPLLSRT